MIWILCKFHVFFIAALIETSDLAKSVIAKSVTVKGKCIWHLQMNLSLKQIQKKNEEFALSIYWHFRVLGFLWCSYVEEIIDQDL